MKHKSCFLCSDVARYKCTRCDVCFCDEEHGRLHISEKIEECSPVTVTAGAMVARRHIRGGEVVLIQEPVVTGPVGLMSGSGVCLHCHGDLDTETCDHCSGCGYPRCCETRGHETRECGVLSVLGPLTDHLMVITIIRVLLLKYSNTREYNDLVMREPDTICSCGDINSWNSYKNDEDLVNMIHDCFKQYWTRCEIETAVEIIQKRAALNNVLPTGTGSVSLYTCLCKYFLHDSISGGNCQVIFNQEFPRSKMIVACKEVPRGEKLILGSNKNICSVCIKNNCECRSLGLGIGRNINIEAESLAVEQ